MDSILDKTNCKKDSCANRAVISLEAQDFCLDHFLAHCYGRLDELEPLVRNWSLDVRQVQTVRALLEECSNRTLLVCLRHEPLTNLDRSRLLEILLQCGDLQFMLRNRSVEVGKSGFREPPFLSPKDRSRGSAKHSKASS